MSYPIFKPDDCVSGYIGDGNFRPKRLRNPEYYIQWTKGYAYLTQNFKGWDYDHPEKPRPKKCPKCKRAGEHLTSYIVEDVRVVKNLERGGEEWVPKKFTCWKCPCGRKFLPEKWYHRSICALGKISRQKNARRTPCLTLFRHCSKDVQEKNHPHEKYFGPKEFASTRSLTPTKRKYYPRATLELIQNALDVQQIQDEHVPVTVDDVKHHAKLFGLTYEESREIMFQEALFSLKRALALVFIRLERPGGLDENPPFNPSMEAVDAKIRKMEMDGEMQKVCEVKAFLKDPFPMDVDAWKPDAPATDLSFDPFEDENEYSEEAELEWNRTHPGMSYSWLHYNQKKKEFQFYNGPVEGRPKEWDDDFTPNGSGDVNDAERCGKTMGEGQGRERGVENSLPPTEHHERGAPMQLHVVQEHGRGNGSEGGHEATHIPHAHAPEIGSACEERAAGQHESTVDSAEVPDCARGGTGDERNEVQERKGKGTLNSDR